MIPRRRVRPILPIDVGMYVYHIIWYTRASASCHLSGTHFKLGGKKKKRGKKKTEMQKNVNRWNISCKSRNEKKGTGQKKNNWEKHRIEINLFFGFLWCCTPYTSPPIGSYKWPSVTPEQEAKIEKKRKTTTSLTAT